MKNLPKSIYRYFSIIFLGFFCTGCGLYDPLPLNQQINPLPDGPICRVALLPFLNESNYPAGEAIFSKVFAAQLQDSGNFFLIQEGDISKVYQQLHLLPGIPPTSGQLQVIASRVKAQLLITGNIIEMLEIPAEHNTVNPKISVEVEIRDIRSGRILWATLHKRDGYHYNKTMHFGTIHTVTGLSRQMAVEIINLWFKKGLSQCEVSPRS